MITANIFDIRDIIKSTFTDDKMLLKKSKTLLLPDELNDLISSFLQVTSFYEILEKNPHIDYKNFNYLELSKYPKTYPFIKHLLRNVDEKLDSDIIKSAEKLKKIHELPNFQINESRLILALNNNLSIHNLSIYNKENKNAINKMYDDFWKNINKYDSKFIILENNKNHIFKYPEYNKYLVNIIEEKFFEDINTVDFKQISKFLLDNYKIETNTERKLHFLYEALCIYGNKKILSYIKYWWDPIERDLLLSLSKNKNSLALEIVYTNLIEQKENDKKFFNITIEKIKYVLLSNKNTPEKIFNLIGLSNMNYQHIFTIPNKNIKKYIEQKFHNSENDMNMKLPLLCKNPNTIDIVYNYITKNKKNLKYIDIEELLVNPTKDEKVQSTILDIFLKKYKYESKNKNFVDKYIDGKSITVPVNIKQDTLDILQHIFNPKVFNYILDNNFLFNTSDVISFMKKINNNSELKIFSDKLKHNFKYNYNAFEYIKKYDLWDILYLDFMSTNPVCIEIFCNISIFKKYIFPVRDKKIQLYACMKLFIIFLNKISNKININKYKSNIKYIYITIDTHMKNYTFNEKKMKIFNIIKNNDIIKNISEL